MNLVAWLWIAFSLVATLIFSMVVWLAGPVVGYADWRPFSDAAPRFVIIFVVWAIVRRRNGGRQCLCGSQARPRRRRAAAGRRCAREG